MMTAYQSSSVPFAISLDMWRSTERIRHGAGIGEGDLPVDLEHDPETRRFAARVLRELADMLEGDEEQCDFIERWREYERVRRNGDSRVIEDDG